MARHQYRIAGELDWMASSGAALLAVSNPLGSNRKLTLRQMSLINRTSSLATGAVSQGEASFLTLARATVSGGVTLAAVKRDANAGAFPAGVIVTKGASIASPLPVRRIATQKQLAPTGLGWLARHRAPHIGAAFERRGKDTGTTGLVIREGEGAALYVSTLAQSAPFVVTADVVVSGLPPHLYSFRTFVNAVAGDLALFAIENAAGSGATVTLRSISVEETGTFDSPYFQLVPIGAVVEGENAAVPAILKMDTASPAPSVIDARINVPILPFGVPENALADSSTGSPKGFNYLKTKDFLGPVYRAIFPEALGAKRNGMPDSWSQSERWGDPFVQRAGIVIREGEGIALVSAAETAAGATAAVGLSGWSSFEISAVIDVEPAIEPVLTLTGLHNPSEVRIFEAGTTTQAAGAESISGGVFAWQFDPEAIAAVDISILSLARENIRILGQSLGPADITIPIQQRLDRQYLNP